MVTILSVVSSFREFWHQQATLDGIDCRLSSGGNVQLLEDAVEVTLNRIDADKKFLGDFGISFASCDKYQNVTFLFG